MKIDTTTLINMSTVDLVNLRDEYTRQRQQLPRMRRASGRSNTLATDVKYCDDAVRLINSILRVRRRPSRPLAEFA